MFGFTRIVQGDSAVRPQSSRRTAEWVQTVIAIVVMVALLGVAVGIKLWAYAPGLFR